MPSQTANQLHHHRRPRTAAGLGADFKRRPGQNPSLSLRPGMPLKPDRQGPVTAAQQQGTDPQSGWPARLLAFDHFQPRASDWVSEAPRSPRQASRTGVLGRFRGWFEAAAARAGPPGPIPVPAMPQARASIDTPGASRKQLGTQVAISQSITGTPAAPGCQINAADGDDGSCHRPSICRRLRHPPRNPSKHRRELRRSGTGVTPSQTGM